MKGEYRHTIDAKGRLAMPAKLREELGEHFTVTKGLDGCLSVYPDAEWASLETRLRSLGNGEKARRIKRYYFANASDVQLDAQGRILIPGSLRDFACLEKDVTSTTRTSTPKASRPTWKAWISEKIRSKR